MLPIGPQPTAPTVRQKHKKYDMNVQVITGPFGRLLWAAPRCPARFMT